MPMLVIRECDIYSGGKVILVASVHTFALNWVLGAIFVTRGRPEDSFMVVVFASNILLAAVFAFRFYSRVTRGKMLAYVLAFALGLAFWSRLAVFVGLELDLGFLFFHRNGLTMVNVTPGQLILMSLFGSTIGWIVARCFKGAIVVQDGTLCPKCGYCLAGCPDRICPECGREFTYQELGTTQAELECVKQDGGGASNGGRGGTPTTATSSG